MAEHKVPSVDKAPPLPCPCGRGDAGCPARGLARFSDVGAVMLCPNGKCAARFRLDTDGWRITSSPLRR
jgi:hypothetical protein